MPKGQDYAMLSAKEWSKNGKRALFVDSSATGFEDICHNVTS